MANTNTAISSHVASQLPFFVRNDHPNFVAFIEAYYEYLEQTSATLADGKVVQRTKSLLGNLDLDNTIDEFSEKLYQRFLALLPKEGLADRDMIMKNAKDFYRARGSEKSMRFLMRVLFGEEIEVYYPKRDVLRASDGKWYIQKVLRVNNTRINGSANSDFYGLELFGNRRLTGNTSNATAIVETVDRFFENGTLVDEITITGSRGDFSSGETIRAYRPNTINTLATDIITANVFGGAINTIRIVNPGARYNIGDPVVVLSSNGSGAVAEVRRVSSGNITSISVLSGGAGFRANDVVLISDESGTGAAAFVSSVNEDEEFHPNLYSIISSTISLEANTILSNSVYSNLNSSNINTTLANAMSFFSYANTGPISVVTVTAVGSGYVAPQLSASANTLIKSLGILGRMEIISGGTGYATNNKIEFINPPSTFGYAGRGNVTAVDANGTITTVKFESYQDEIIGGTGYSQASLPSANVISSTGTGANIAVMALLGYGESLASANSIIGAIERIDIINRGSGYTETDASIDLSGSGDGTATANLTVIDGAFSYPGRFINDDGFLSSFNFLQDRDYYQNFSYVIKVRKSLDEYRDTFKSIVHPAGMKMFGEFVYRDFTESTVLPEGGINAEKIIIRTGTYNVANSNTVIISLVSHGVIVTDNVYLEFLTGDTANVSNGLFMVETSANTDNFTITHQNTATTTGNVMVGRTVI